MKKFILLTIFFIYSSINAQDIDWENNTIDHNPNPKNELSKYFKKEISKKHLRKATFAPKKNNITLSFFINKENKPFGISINSFRSSELRKTIIEAFKKYPLEKLNLDSLNKRNRYSLQIISKKGAKNIFNCSSKIIIETLPICDSCNDLEYYEDIETCIEQKLNQHFLENIDFSIIKRFKANKDFNIILNMFVDINGGLNIKKLKGSIIFKKPIENAIKSFPKFESAATLNGIKTTWNYNTKFNFDKNNIPFSKEKKLNYDSIFKRNSSNDFAQFLKTKITSEDFKKSNLNRIFNSLTLSFELDKKKKPFNISTNARSSYLNNLIITSFKEYPIEKLTFSNKSTFNSYFTQILSLEENKILIKTNELIGYERVPIFPGCENSENVFNAKKCFSRGVQMHFMKKFNADLPNKLGLSRGRKRVFIAFKINKFGKISDIKVKAPHPKIKEEVIAVMKKLPKVKPAVQSNKKVNIKYSIPFTLIVE